MHVVDTPLSGLKVVQLDVKGDARGFFVERYNETKFAEVGLPTYFAQDNHSRSRPGILRGLHYQHTPAQGKLVGVVRGAIWDVAVDVRPQSPTFGRHFGLELSDENGKLLWMPPGFAHGFCVLGESLADVFYKVTATYFPGSEGGIKFDDPKLAIAWPIKDPLISERDKALSSWDEYAANAPAWDA